MIKLNDKIINIGHFPDGTILMKENLKECRLDTENVIDWRFENNEEMVVLMYLVRHLNENGYDKIKLIMPYIPNARQDRTKSTEDVFTLKYFAEFINSLGFSEVIVYDPHSSVSEALINKLSIIQPKDIIELAVKDIKRNIGHEVNMMFYPDEGAMKRYSSMSTLPYAFGIKNRDWQTGKIQGLDIAGSSELIKNSTILIVDDICSRGGTFYHSAKKLKELGADKIFLYVTHCENTIIEGDVLTSGLIEKVYTTDSLFTKENDKIEVLNIW